MPISNSWINQGINILLKKIEALELAGTGGGGGGHSYSHIASARISLEAGQTVTILPPSPTLLHREISIKLLSGDEVILLQGDPNIETGISDNSKLFPGVDFFDPNNGGIRVDAFAPTAPAEISMVIRQVEIIDYILTQQKHTKMIVTSLWVNTKKDYVFDVDDGDFMDMIEDATGSDQRKKGYKIFFVYGAKLGEETVFNIDASSANYSGVKIEMQLINPFDLLLLLFKAGNTYYLYDSVIELCKGQYGIGGIFYHGSKVEDPKGGELKIKNKVGILCGRFVTYNPENYGGDTCIIESYQPNVENPDQGGTFVLTGF